MKFKFNKKAMEALANEFRRVSWGAGTAATAVAYNEGSGIAMLLGASAWLALQVLAFVLESLDSI